MNRKQWYTALFVMALFSMIGSGIATVVFKTGYAEAAQFASTIQSYTSDGQPVQAFFGEDGKMRIQLGTYNAPGERGLPLIGLSDNNGHLRMLFRLAGPNESPVIVMKDKSGSDRLVMGLAMSDKSEDPFLSATTSDGKKQLVFGNY